MNAPLPNRPYAAQDLRIRLAVSEDLPALLAIRNWAIANTYSCFTNEPETLASWHTRWNEKCPTHPWLVAEVQGVVIGYALSHALLDRCGLSAAVETSVYIAPEHHGRGVATALYRNLIGLLKAQGYASLVAVISLPNPASEHLHETYDFRRVGTLSRVGWKFDRWHDVGYWQLTLCESSDPPLRIKQVSEVQSILVTESDHHRSGEHRSAHADCTE